MELQNTDNDIVQHMSTYNFNAPIKVTLVFDEAESNELNKSVGNRMDNCFESPAMQSFQTSNIESQSRCVDGVNSSNVCFDTMDNILNIYDLNYETLNLRSEDNSSQNNNVVSNQVINHEGPNWTAQTNTSFPKDSIIHSYTNNGSRQHIKHSTIINSENHKTNILYLLDNVSYNLIEISKCFYFTFITKPQNHVTYLKAVEYYKHFKYNLFDHSYPTVKSLILPLETHPTFIKKIINRTLALAFRKSWYNISNGYLVKLIGNMLDYTKNRIEMESKSSDPSSTTFNKKETSKTISKNVNSNKKNEDSNLINILSCGPKDKEITISVEPNILNRTHNCIIISDQLIKRRRTDGSYNPEMQRTLTKENNHHGRSRTQTTRHLPNESMSFAPQETLSHNNLTYNGRDVISIDSEDVNDNHLAISRSSVSRDSGFNSPVNTVPYSENQTGNSRNGFDLLTTSSEHTTTMSRVGNALPNTCKICCSITTKMCLGCYREYYCTLNCQMKDWHRHKQTCQN
ncbi:uncharacterized protein LOC124534260 [Vanessa cardui]|uniref:uncharacterized protein LOC124534260 n=1 Tax=Vanessa cardui TaxID=171605 RepID=UPI001F12FF39|nr:uncharacterized protein LOC124534260 [Vanessa cardui]